MSRIQLLDDNLINKIAAGEVVERPASIVKELVENCIDAGATKIVVELQEGGRKRILISDNGCGMSAADASKSLLRHATSKIKNAEDLFNLQTMGFRGEALASISAVCRFTLMTCEQGSMHGIRLHTEGGGTFDETPWQSSGGTTIICDDIFYNVPVRQKFLKAAAAEYGAVLEFMLAVAIAYPKIDFTMVHNGKESLRAAAVVFTPDEIQASEANPSAMSERVLRTRFAQVMKGDAGLGMVFTQAQTPYATMTALISAPGVERGSPKDMVLFVNGRWVKDKSLRFAVLRGYHSHLLRGKYPVVAVFIHLDSGLVDANVHPAKTEVRLQYANEIHSMVASGIREGLRRADWASHASTGTSFPAAVATSHAMLQSHSSPSPWNESASGGGGRVRAFSERETSAKGPIWRDVTPVSAGMFDDLASGRQESRPASPDLWGTVDSSSIFSPTSSQLGPAGAGVIQTVPWDELSYLGSVADCYLMFSHGDRRSGARMLAVDQHAFHERVLYERLIRNTDLLQSSQSLLVPEGVTLRREAVEAIRSLKPQLEANGFRIEIIDETMVEVRAVPVLLSKSDLQVLMESLAEHEHSPMPLDGNVGLAHDILATMACHSAVRAGEKLGDVELKMLINEARDVDFFHNCPHGRRVFRWWDEAQIGRWFDR